MNEKRMSRPWKPALTLIIFCFALLGEIKASYAAEPQKIGEFGDWSSYVLDENNGRVCYMVSQPKSAAGTYSQRGDVFTLITHRPAENTKDVFSYITGYSYKTGSDATISIDGKSFMLFTQNDTAWAPDATTDAELSKAIRSGNTMVVKGTSTKGTLTTDTFSLKGATAAYNAISTACRV
jgi:hypothetical protein